MDIPVEHCLEMLMAADFLNLDRMCSSASPSVITLTNSRRRINLSRRGGSTQTRFHPRRPLL